MEVTPVTPADGSLLQAVRSTLDEADTALLCVAFVGDAGVHLVREELQGLGGHGRLLATTVFGSTTGSALTKATHLGNGVRTLNPAGSATYHPKLYLGRRGDRLSAVLGSANLTRGLVCNIELACHFEGHVSDRPLGRMWAWAEAQWESPDASSWTPESQAAQPSEELLESELASLLHAEIELDPTFLTLGAEPRPNVVREVAAHGLYVETGRSRALGRPPQEIPAWMLNLAWGYLRTHGELSNSHLLNELRVHRSSAVCALLARLPGVVRAHGRSIVLRWEEAASTA